MTTPSPEQKLIEALEHVQKLLYPYRVRMEWHETSNLVNQSLESARSLLAELAELREKAQWIAVGDKLPDINRPVALMNVSRMQNVPFNLPLQQCGFLSHFGKHYWSVYGERALSLDAFTHWMYLPEMIEQRERT